MSQSVHGDLHHRTERNGGRDRPTAAFENMRNFKDSNRGDGDGFLAESQAGSGGRHPAKSNSELLKEPAPGFLTGSNPTNSNSPYASGKSGSSSQEKPPSPDKTQENPNTNHAWKQANSSRRLRQRPSLAKLCPEDGVEGGASFTLPHDLSFPDTRDSSETDTTAEIVGEVSEQGLPLNGQEQLDTDTADRGKDAMWREIGIGQWNRTMLMSLAVFVGLRLCYQAWFGQKSFFSRHAR